MNNEFEIHFSYKDQFYNARVVRSPSKNQIEYAVRPFSLSLVRRFGRQTLILKKDKLYSCGSILSSAKSVYIDAIISELKQIRE